LHNPEPGYVFSSRGGAPPVVSILPSLEVVVSVRRGDDPSACQMLWECLARSHRRPLPYVVDDRLGIGVPRSATAQDHEALSDALKCACFGPEQRPRIDWSGLQFQDAAHVDEVPIRTQSCSVGAIRESNEPRGISLRVTYPFDHHWSDSVVMARDIAARWPDLFRWIGVGLRFMPVSMHSGQFEAATEVIRGRSRRFLAVDIGDLFGFHSSVWQHQIRTPLWTMVLSPGILDRIGGMAHARAQCDSPLRCEALGASLLIQAGDGPMRGDVNRQEDILAYRMLDRLLTPVRCRGGVLLLPPWDEVAAIDWHERFQFATHSDSPA
jgi:hypothetical protein